MSGRELLRAGGRRQMWRVLAAALFLLIAAPALAVQPSEMLKDPALEARARELSGQLRCLVCQNESIDESDADLARDIRVLIRERITKGESNTQIRDFLVSRYGDFILLKPPFNLSTALLWFTPPLAVLLGALAIWGASRRRAAAPAPLSADEERRLAELSARAGMQGSFGVQADGARESVGLEADASFAKKRAGTSPAIESTERTPLTRPTS